MATSAQRIRTLTENVLDEFESGQSVSALVRQAHRISVLRHDYAAQVWFEFQQREIGVTIRKDDDVLLSVGDNQRGSGTSPDCVSWSCSNRATIFTRTP